MASALRRLLICLTAASLVGACLAPTLPLPPPDQPRVEGPDENGETHLIGRVQTGAAVYALNRSTDKGTFQFTDQAGNYDLTLTTEVGDQILMWYALGQQQSDHLEFEIRAEQ